MANSKKEFESVFDANLKPRTKPRLIQPEQTIPENNMPVQTQIEQKHEITVTANEPTVIKTVSNKKTPPLPKKRETKSKKVTWQLYPELYDDIERVAKNNGYSVQDFVNFLLAEAIKEYK